MSTSIPQVEQLLDFLQGEPEPLHLLNRNEPLYVICREEAELSSGARCSWQQSPALVEANGVYTQFGALRCFANRDCAPLIFQSSQHKKIIHSGLHSRVKPKN